MISHRLAIAASPILFAWAGMAAPIQPCAPNSLGFYVIALEVTGCSIGNEQFLEFNVTLAQDFGTAQLRVIPLDIPHRPTIVFQLNQPGAAFDLRELITEYEVRVLPGGRPISQAMITITDSSVSGRGILVANELLHSPGIGANLRAIQRAQSNQSGFARFEPQFLLDVNNDFILNLNVSEPQPPAFFGSVVMEFDEVPESDTTLLAAAGLLLLGAAGARRSRNRRRLAIWD